MIPETKHLILENNCVMEMPHKECSFFSQALKVVKIFGKGVLK
jgi:hypothetical protein